MYTLSLDKIERRALLFALNKKRESIMYDDLPTETVNYMIERILAAPSRRRLRDLFHSRFNVDFSVFEKKLIVDSLCEAIFYAGDDTDVNEALLQRILAAERKEKA